MAEYITREAALMAVCSAELPDKTEDGTPILNGKRKVSDCVRRIKAIPAADVVEVVRCKDCVYWQKPQVKLNDGTYRDYEQGEYENGSFFGLVTVDVGINIGSFCAKYNTEHQNRIPQYMGENDFCSKGYKLREES